MRIGVIFSTIASVVALTISVLSFYYAWWDEDPRLIAKTDRLLFSFAAVTGGEPMVTKRYLDLRAKFILTNPGNRPATLVRAFWAIPLSQEASCEGLPANADYPATARPFKARGFELFPLSLEPSFVDSGRAIVVEGNVSDLPHPNKRLAGFESMQSCVVFVATDHVGETHTTVFAWIKRLPPFSHKFYYAVSHEAMGLI